MGLLNNRELPVVVERRRKPRLLAEEGCYRTRVVVGVMGMYVYEVEGEIEFDVEEAVVMNDDGWWMVVVVEIELVMVDGAIVVVEEVVVVLVERIQMMVVEEVNGMVGVVFVVAEMGFCRGVENILPVMEPEK